MTSWCWVSEGDDGTSGVGSSLCLCEWWEKKLCLICGWGEEVLDDGIGAVSTCDGTLSSKLHSVVCAMSGVAGALART